MSHAPVADRLLAKVQADEGGCWVWVGAKNGKGYGRVYMDGRLRFAHRVAYETFVGPIPDGMQIDHLCRTPACINPNHLEPVTNRENQLRALRSFDVAATCVSGLHATTPENVRRRADGSRRCRACDLLAQRKRKGVTRPRI